MALLRVSEEILRTFPHVLIGAPVGRGDVKEILAELASLVQAYCGGRARAAILDRNSPSAALSAL
ncbi:MAG TPA: hypothetical protein VGL03_14260 [Thermoanaerobaculia bacterium]|jgi:hypothetical protein